MEPADRTIPAHNEKRFVGHASTRTQDTYPSTKIALVTQAHAASAVGPRARAADAGSQPWHCCHLERAE